MTNLEKLDVLKKELSRLDGIFNELSIKDEKVLDLIIQQINLVEGELELLMQKAKIDEKLNDNSEEDVEEVGKLKGIYDSLLNRIKSREKKEDVAKSIFETEYEPDTIVDKIIKEREKEKKEEKNGKVRSMPIFVNGEIIE
jgi:hypothetical protein